MRHFAEIWEIACQRKGGELSLEALLTRPKAIDELEALQAHSLLETFAGGIFTTGLATKVVTAKWPGILQAFHQFDLGWCANIDGERFDDLLSDKRVIRHAAKIESIRNNAIWLIELTRTHKTAAHFFANWPREDYVGLLEVMKQDGSRLGGNVGAYCLRRLGFDSFVLTRDVTARLIAEGVIDKPATSKRAMQTIQTAFNTWRAESGRSLTEVSQVLAYSVGT